MRRLWPPAGHLIGLDKLSRLLAGPSEAAQSSALPAAKPSGTWLASVTPPSFEKVNDSVRDPQWSAVAKNHPSLPASADWRHVVQELVRASEHNRRLAAELNDLQTVRPSLSALNHFHSDNANAEFAESEGSPEFPAVPLSI